MARNVERRSRRRAPAAAEYIDKATEAVEEEEEERPRRGRRRGAEKSEGRSGGRRRAREPEPEDEEEERPRRRAKRSRDEEEEKPRRGRRARAEEDDEEFEDPDDEFEDEDEDEDERPSRRRDRDDDNGKSKDPVASGWDAFEDRKKASGGGFPERLKLELDDPVVLRSLDDEPFVVYGRHWIEELGKGKQKSFTCLGEDCPLCDIGDEPELRTCFNVALVFKDDGPVDPEVLVWELPPGTAGKLRDIADDRRKGPLTKNYLVVKQYKADNGFIAYNLEVCKERDLEEDWEVDPLTSDELDELEEQAYTADEYPSRHTRRDIQKVVAEIEGGGERKSSRRDEERGSGRGRRGRR